MCTYTRVQAPNFNSKFIIYSTSYNGINFHIILCRCNSHVFYVLLIIGYDMLV